MAPRTQAHFSHPDVGYAELWDCIRVHRPQLAREVLLFLTDTCHWRRGDAGVVTAVVCRSCAVDCRVAHLMCCPALQRRRADAAVTVCDILEDDRWAPSASMRAECARLRNTAPLDVRSVLVRLRLASGAVDSIGVVAASFGAIRAECATEFRMTWGVPPEQLVALRCALFVAASRMWVNRVR